MMNRCLRRFPRLRGSSVLVLVVAAGIAGATLLACTTRSGSPGARVPSILALGNGHGTVQLGEQVYAQNCAVCHGDQLDGNNGKYPPLVGRGAVLDHPNATELYQYVRRAMPFGNPASLSDDDYYAVVAYMLYKNGVLPENAKLDATSIAKITLPGATPIAPPLPGAPTAQQQLIPGSTQAMPYVTPGPGR
jgi:mono/diheme cytochrome c family protein